jgi:hypothetical protein
MQERERIKRQEIQQDEQIRRMAMYEEKKEYLNKCRVIYKLICTYEDELHEHRLLTQCAPIGCYEQIARAPGTSYGTLEPSVIKILEYEEKIKDAIAKYIDTKTECLQAIEQLTDATEKLVLRMRYLNGKTHREVAQDIGYSVEQEKRICKSALENFKIPQS